MCLPYAGGSAADFYDWPPLMPAGVEVLAVQLPGRANRLSERRFARLAPLVEALRAALDARLQPPFALFGHSLGALVAYELARRLRPGPVRLCVSGHRAPQLPSRDPPLRDLPDHELVQQLRRLNGTPEEVLRQRELRELMLPLLRDDFAVAETYRHEPAERLACPLLALGGTEDQLVEEWELRAWAEVTRGPFRMQMVPGDHFFLKSAREAVLAAVSDELQDALEVPAA